MAAQLGGDQDEPISAINVVPLVDIILVVLIIFMVTAPLVLKPTIDINLPKAASGQETESSPLEIEIGADGALVLNGQRLTLDALGPAVRDIVTKNPEVQAILQADKTSTLERLTPVIDIINSTGVKKIGFAVQRAAGAKPN